MIQTFGSRNSMRSVSLRESMSRRTKVEQTEVFEPSLSHSCRGVEVSNLLELYSCKHILGLSFIHSIYGHMRKGLCDVQTIPRSDLLVSVISDELVNTKDQRYGNEAENETLGGRNNRYKTWLLTSTFKQLQPPLSNSSLILLSR